MRSPMHGPLLCDSLTRMSSPGPRIGPAEVLFGAGALLCLAALIWPGYAWLGNRIEPRSFGLPFTLVYDLGCVAAAFVMVLGYHLLAGDRE